MRVFTTRANAIRPDGLRISGYMRYRVSDTRVLVPPLP